MKKLFTVALLIVLSVFSDAQTIPTYLPYAGLVAWYPFSGNSIDSSAHENDLSNIGSVTYSTDRFGHINSSANFSGGVQHFYKSYPSLPSGNSDRTISFWMSQQYADSAACMFSFWNGTSVGPGCYTSYEMYIDRTSYLMGSSGYYFWGRCNDVFWNKPVALNTWYNIVLLYHNNNITLYINDSLAGSYALPDATPLSTTLSNFYIGTGAFADAGVTIPFHGKIDDFGVWSRILSRCEVHTLYYGATIDSTGEHINGDSILCVGNSSSMTDVVYGGIWSASNTHLTINSAGIINAISSGIDTIGYTKYVGCVSSTTVKVITINTLPVSVDSIVGTTSICVGAVTTFSDYISGGVWSVSNTYASINSVGVFTGISAGIDTIRYIISNSCGSSYTYKIVHIDSNISLPLIVGSNNLCLGGSITLSNPIIGGVWNSSNTSVLNISSTGIILSGSIGYSVVSYSISGLCGSSVVTDTIHINPLPTTIIGTNNVCIGSTYLLTDTSAGTWSSSNTSVATINSLGYVSGVSAGIDIISYTNSYGCFITKPITVNLVPLSASIIGADSVCVGSTITLYDSVLGGVWHIFNSHLIGVGEIVTGMSAGIDTVSYVCSNVCGVSTFIKSVKVNPMPFVYPIYGLDSVCAGATITLYDSTIGGVWSNADTSVATNVGGIITGINSWYDDITYSITNSCGTASDVKYIYVNGIPDTYISGADTICAGVGYLYTSSLGGVWSISNINAIIDLYGNVTGVNSGLDTISYINSNSCGYNIGIKSIYVMSLPVAGVIVIDSSLCVGTTTTVYSSVTGGVWASTNNNSMLDSNSITTYTVGIDTIYHVVSNYCGTDISRKSINIDSCATTLTHNIEKNKINVYPNPNNGDFIINIDNYTITDMLGCEVFYTNINQIIHINKPGIYIIKHKDDFAKIIVY